MPCMWIHAQAGCGRLLRLLLVQRSPLSVRPSAARSARRIVRRPVQIGLALALLFGFTDVRAQGREPGSASLSQPLRLGSVDLTLNWRSRAEYWNWFQDDGGNGRYRFGHSQ